MIDTKIICPRCGATGRETIRDFAACTWCRWQGPLSEARAGASSPLKLANVRFLHATASARRTGLLGFVSCDVNGTLRLDGITVRRTRSGSVTLSFPERTDGSGARHPIVRPLHNDARREVERLILEALPEGFDDPEDAS